MRRFFGAAASLGSAIVLGAAGALAQSFPSRPITMIVPYASGGSADVVGRLVATEMSKTLGQNVILELKPGAGGNIGAELVAKTARADGYTILLASLSLSSNVSLMKLNFDPRRDLAAVAGIATLPDVPTIAESGFPGFEFGAYLALFAPAATPKEAIATLEDAVAKAIQVPAVKERLTLIAAEPVPVSAAGFQKYFNDDVERFARLVREGKLQTLR